MLGGSLVRKLRHYRAPLVSCGVVCWGNIRGNILEKQEHADFERKNGSRERRAFSTPNIFRFLVRRSAGDWSALGMLIGESRCPSSDHAEPGTVTKSSCSLDALVASGAGRSQAVAWSDASPRRRSGLAAPP